MCYFGGGRGEGGGQGIVPTGVWASAWDVYEPTSFKIDMIDSNHKTQQFCTIFHGFELCYWW